MDGEDRKHARDNADEWYENATEGTYEDIFAESAMV